ncbi:MAG TPA: transmembrane 220 family protein [Segetibacter sp.]|jgi:hypothetical protein
MRAFNLVFILVFIVFAGLQYNDPDPYIWMPIYLFGSFLCYKAYNKEYNPTLYILGFLGYGGYAIYLLLDKTGVINWASVHHGENIAETMKATKPWIEETREFFGLLILIIVLLIDMRWLKKVSLRVS